MMAMTELITPSCLDLSLRFDRCNCLLAFWRRDLPLITGRPLSASGKCCWALASWTRDAPPTATAQSSGHIQSVEKLWQEFFSDPSQWWDCREKVNARYPDFKHKITQKALWLNSKFNPPWVEAKLAVIPPGTLQPDLFSWNRRLMRSNTAGEYQKTLKVFYQMQCEGMKPNSHTFVPVITACTNLQALEEGKRIHIQIIHSGGVLDVYVGSCLVDMYGKCGNIEDAQVVFNNMPARNVVAWSAMILGSVKCGQGEKALELYRQMRQEGVEPDSITFVGVLNACSSLAALEEGRHVHQEIIQRDCESDIFLGNSLVDMYAKCGSIEDAWEVFNKMPIRNVVSWSTMILGYVKCGQGHKALELYQLMQGEGVEPNCVTFTAVLNACASVVALEEGRLVHEMIIERGFDFDIFVGNSLVDMYAKCGSMDDACTVFIKMPKRNVVAWNAMILGYVKCGQGQKALEIFQQIQREGVNPDPGIFTGVLNACGSLGALEEGKCIHEEITKRGLESDIIVASCLVDMYAKCGSIEDAWRVFNEMTTRNMVAWSAMIMGYVKCGQEQKALEICRWMQREGVEPKPIIFVNTLNACASIGALEEGRRVHEQIIQGDCESDVLVSSSLVNMYSKCGSIENAWRVFNNMPTRNLLSWNAMIGGYAMHGLAKQALELFKQMGKSGVEIDWVTMVSVLSACSHAGLLNEGLHILESMTSVYSISATMEHYTSIVDLLGRAGRLHEAEDLINTRSCESNAFVWMALLNACRVHYNVEMGEHVLKQVLELDPGNLSGSVLVSDIDVAPGKWDSSARVEQQRLKSGVKTILGYTLVEVNSEVHSFIDDDNRHPQILEIRAELNKLYGVMKEAGYVPDTRFVLHSELEKEKVRLLCHHSEKLAVAYGLISAPPGIPLHFFKNMHMCGDCHTAIKFIAKIVRRAIIVRDENRFHRFEDGLCSCRDYW